MRGSLRTTPGFLVAALLAACAGEPAASADTRASEDSPAPPRTPADSAERAPSPEDSPARVPIPEDSPAPVPTAEDSPARGPAAEPAAARGPAAEPAAMAQRANGAPCADGDSCLERARQARRQGHLADAVRALSRGCDLGHAGSCYQLGVAYRDGRGVQPDPPKGEALLRDACAAGASAACDALGH